jgi:hypothetical protein
MTTIRMHKTIAGAAAVVTACALTTLPLAAPAVAVPSDGGDHVGYFQNTNDYIEVAECHTTTQLCPEIAFVSYWFETSTVIVDFTANPNHCADMIAHFMVDGYEVESRVVGPGQIGTIIIEPLTPIPGPHSIGVKAEGIKGGCNTGFISAWGGNLHIESQMLPP